MNHPELSVPVTPAAANGQPKKARTTAEWKWEDFWRRHDRRKFTPVFNGYLESTAADPSIPLVERVQAAILRSAWGNHSDCCVQPDGETPLTQTDLAGILGVARQRINEASQELTRRKCLRIIGREMHPIDDPTEAQTEADLSGPLVHLSEQEAKVPAMRSWLREVYAQSHPDQFQKLEQAEQELKRLKTQVLDEWRRFKRQSLSGPLVPNPEICPAPTGQNGTTLPDNLSGPSVPNGEPILIEVLTKKPLTDSASSSPPVSDPPAATPTQQETTTTTTMPIDASPEARDAEAQARIAAALAPHTIDGKMPDTRICDQLLTASRRARPDVMPEEIADAIEQVGKLPRKEPHLGLFLALVPQRLAAAPRQQMPPPAPAAPDPGDPIYQQWRAQQIAELERPDISEADRHLMRLCLGIEKTEPDDGTV